MIHVVDYGLGNLGSIVNMCKRLGLAVTMSSDKSDVQRAERLILPGVGHFDQGMTNLRSLDLIGPLTDRVMSGVAQILGICLGAQLMTRGSHEGSDPLSWYANPSPPVELFARGVDVEVAWPGGGTLRCTGNSFAAPHIAGIAALVLAKHPELTPFQLKSVLHLTASNTREAP